MQPRNYKQSHQSYTHTQQRRSFVKFNNAQLDELAQNTLFNWKEITNAKDINDKSQFTKASFFFNVQSHINLQYAKGVVTYL